MFSDLQAPSRIISLGLHPRIMNFIAEVPETCGLQTDDCGNLHVATWIARQAKQAKQAATPNFLFHAISTITYNL